MVLGKVAEGVGLELALRLSTTALVGRQELKVARSKVLVSRCTKAALLTRWQTAEPLQVMISSNPNGDTCGRTIT